MIEKLHNARLDRTISYQVNTPTNTGGDQVDNWGSSTSLYAGLLKSSGKENFENDQEVAKEKRAYLVRNESTVFSVANTRIKETTDVFWFYVTGFHPFKGSRNYLVLEVESRDNEAVTAISNEAQVVIDGFPYEITATERTGVIAVVNAMVDSGNWANTKTLAVLSMSNWYNAHWDWKRQETYTSVNVDAGDHIPFQGILYNGTDSYTKSNFIPSTGGMLLNDSYYHGYCYSNSDTSNNKYLYGVFDGTDQIVLRQDVGNSRIEHMTNAQAQSIYATATGAFLGNTRYGTGRDDAVNQELFIDGTQVDTEGDASTGVPTKEIYIGGANSNGIASNLLNARQSFFHGIISPDLTELNTELGLIKTHFIV